jgi:hypothetical protein
MTKTQRYKLMGQIRSVSAILVEQWNHDGSEVRWVTEPIVTRAGWVVGFRTPTTRKRHKGSGASYSMDFSGSVDEDYQPNYAEQIKGSGIECAKVVFWFNRLPVLVPLTCLFEDGKVPDCREHRWPENMKSIASELDRGADGRFIKWVPSAGRVDNVSKTIAG